MREGSPRPRRWSLARNQFQHFAGFFARIRKAIKRGAKVFAIGPQTDLTYKVEWLGADTALLAKLPKAVTDVFAAAERPAERVLRRRSRNTGCRGCRTRR